MTIIVKPFGSAEEVTFINQPRKLAFTVIVSGTEAHPNGRIGYFPLGFDKATSHYRSIQTVLVHIIKKQDGTYQQINWPSLLPHLPRRMRGDSFTERERLKWKYEDMRDHWLIRMQRSSGILSGHRCPLYQNEHLSIEEISESLANANTVYQSFLAEQGYPVEVPSPPTIGPDPVFSEQTLQTLWNELHSSVYPKKPTFSRVFNKKVLDKGQPSVV